MAWTHIQVRKTGNPNEAHLIVWWNKTEPDSFAFKKTIAIPDDPGERQTLLQSLAAEANAARTSHDGNVTWGNQRKQAILDAFNA